MSVTFVVAGLGDVELNMSNAGARFVLRTLAFDGAGDCCGTVANDDLPGFIEKCDLALASIKAEPSLDPGTPTAEYRGGGGCTVIDCGFRPGYLEHRITELRVLAMVARDSGSILNWY